jgi:hypothetical protein
MKISGNNFCPCGSGDKYKKCCMGKPRFPFAMPAKREFELFPPAEEEDFEEEIEQEEPELNGLYNLQRLILGSKPHIKAYKKLRKIHTEVARSMLAEIDSEKHTLKIEKPPESGGSLKNAMPVNVSFDRNTDEGDIAFLEINVYKVAPNVKSLTEIYIEKSRFRKAEKVAMLQNMLNSRRSLYEITETEPFEGLVHLRDVFTGEEIVLTDMAMSMNSNKDIYAYRRLITVGDITFGDCLSAMFDKKDKFIADFIKKHKKNYDKEGELLRFIELYKYQISGKNKVKLQTRKV